MMNEVTKSTHLREPREQGRLWEQQQRKRRAVPDRLPRKADNRPARPLELPLLVDKLKREQLHCL